MKHLVIPDCQVKQGDPIEHLTWAGLYAVKHKPDVIINIGDFFDMPSLSSYDKGKKSFEGRRYFKDIAAGQTAMDTFMQPIRDEQDRQRKNKEKIWKPRFVYCLGNHEARIDRATEEASEFDGLISMDDLGLEDFGWEVYPFLEVAIVDGIAYSHYFTSGVMGRPVSNSRLLINKKMMSCVQGHVQDRDIAYGRKADGSAVTGLFVGIFYQHDEGYLNPQTNKSWRGIWMLNDVKDGSFDELPISLCYLKRKYGKGNKRMRV
tara:strand:- start:7942 stop:8727 length:786 start_codon:yes stop_codon:yes gene_type:complete